MNVIKFLFVFFFPIDDVPVDIVTFGQRLGGDKATNYKIRLDNTYGHLDTILYISSGSLCLESRKFLQKLLNFIQL